VKSTILTAPYREAFARFRHAIAECHPTGTEEFEVLSDCLDAFSQLIAEGVPAVEHVEIKEAG
jgi:hypothetical protein